MVYSTDIDEISEEHKSLLSSYLDYRENAPYFPLCLQPPAIDTRIHAQKSVFTIHGKYFNAFKKIVKENNAKIVKIRFSTEQAWYIKLQLEGMGITEGTLFPGLEGLSEDIKWEYGIE